MWPKVPFRFRVRPKTKTIAAASDTLTLDDEVVVLNPSAPQAISLPDISSSDGIVLRVKNISSFASTLTPSGAQTIDGAVSYVLDVLNSAVVLVSIAGNWRIS